jgi:hypothetical protein
MSRNTVGGATSGMSAIGGMPSGGITEMTTNKSVVGNRYY